MQGKPPTAKLRALVKMRKELDDKLNDKMTREAKNKMINLTSNKVINNVDVFLTEEADV